MSHKPPKQEKKQPLRTAREKKADRLLKKHAAAVVPILVRR